MSKGNWPTPAQRAAAKRPLRTLQEMADEFGISKASLLTYMGHSKAPLPPRQTYRSIGGSNTYVDPIAMREWWAGYECAASQGEKENGKPACQMLMGHCSWPETCNPRGTCAATIPSQDPFHYPEEDQ